jgi:hypothetical protein
MTNNYRQFHSLKNECPYNFGEAVYAARAMMTQYDFGLLFYRSLCEIDFSQRSFEDNDHGGKHEEPSLNVYPNPVSDVLTFELNGAIDIDSKCVIEIFNIDGKKILSETTKGKQTIDINVHTLHGGVYYYVYTIDAASFRGSVVVVK